MSVFEYDVSGLQKLVKGLRSIPKAVETAASRSINRTLTTARLEITKNVREDYNLKSASFKGGLPIKKANNRTLEGRLHASGGPGVPLIGYQARARVLPNGAPPSTWWKGEIGHKVPGPAIGVSGVVRRKTGRKKWRGAFVARMGTGHVGVFRRVPEKKMRNSRDQAIRELYGPSAARILVNGRYTQDIMSLVSATMRKNMLRETKFIIRKLGKL